MRRTGLLALSLLALTACGGGDDDPALTESPAASTSAPAGVTASPTASTSPTSALPPGCASPSPLPTAATEITATVAGGTVTTAKRTYDVKAGSTVRLLVTADVVDEVHVHGYDLHADTQPGCPVALDFQARIPGEVEVELEKAHLKLFELRAR